jgi:flagellar biosynthetic protein FliR
VNLEVSSLLALLLGSVRAAAWLVICPPFNTRTVPAAIKALLSVAVALPLVPQLRGQVPGLDTGELLVATVEQVVVGVALGFVTALFFAAVQAAGDLIDTFGGFSLSFAFDPLSANQSSVFGRFYNLFAMTLLFVTNGHLLVLRGFLRSYQVLPLDGTLSLSRLSEVLTHGLPAMFLAALQIAGPLMAVLFLADVALGLLNRVAPALNALGLGFPAKILITLLLGGTALATLPRALAALIGHAIEAMLSVAGG